MLSNLRLIYPPCSDNPNNMSVLLLCVDAQRYLFNIPEGAIRALIQQGAMPHVKYVKNVFIPRVGVKECGGLPGLLMSMADVGCRDIAIHAPPVMSHYLATCRFYVRRDSIKVKVKEAPLVDVTDAESNKATSSEDDHMVYQDDYITVRAIPLLPTGFNLPTPEPYGSPGWVLKRKLNDTTTKWTPTPESLACIDAMFPNDEEKPALEMDEEQAEEMAKRDMAMRQKLKGRIAANYMNLGPPPLLPVPLSEGDQTTEQGPVLVYIVQGKEVEGRIDAEKANSMGVPMGKLLAVLKRGEDVEVTRPVGWASYGTKERAAWFTYSTKMKPSLNETKGRGKVAQKKKAALKQTADVMEMSKVETEQITVKSSDVVGKPQPGFVFAQVYLPSIHYLDSFLDSSTQSLFQRLAAQPHTIVHAVHPDVLRDQRYQKFIHTFKQTHHTIVSRPFHPDRLAFPDSALANLRMGRLDEKLFPPPAYTLEPQLKLSDIGLEGSHLYLSDLDTNIGLHPPFPPAVNDVLSLDLDTPLDSEKVQRLVSYQDFSGRKQVTEADKKAKQAAWKAYENEAKSLQEETNNGRVTAEGEWPLKLTTLGTGSAQPNKYRNVSGHLVHMPGKDAGYILLDAGESTYSQLARKFGEKGINEVIANIRMIFLSHIHADHHVGVIRILVERAKLDVKRPLFVVATSYMQQYLEELNMIHSLGISDDVESNGVVIILSQHLDSGSGVELDVEAYPDRIHEEDKDRFWRESLEAEASAILRKRGAIAQSVATISANLYAKRIDERKRTQALRKHMTQLLHGTQVFTAEVDHRISHCYGIVLRGNGWSSAYSGDTRPCDNLVEAGRGVDFLLHEATMEDNLEGMAQTKGHSTFGQAINIAKQMRVKYLILTHFSQRYAKLPRFDAGIDLGKLKIGIAFDLLTMQMSDLEKLMKYRGVLEMMYEVDNEEEDVEMEDVIEASLKKENGETAKDGVIKAAPKRRASGAKEVAMAVDDASFSGDVLTDVEKRVKDRLFQRKFVKTHEFQYASFELKSVPSSTNLSEKSTPSELIIAKAIETALVDLNGVVNGSFNWDLLDVQLLSSKNVVRAVIKVPSSHLETLRASISAGLFLRHDGISYQARFDRIFSALDIGALETDNSSQWFDDLVRQKKNSQGQQ